MAGKIDFARLRDQTMDAGQDDAVTVNTRALIDKVLARYSSDYTTLRELIQNAADAGATKVSIKFETVPSLHTPAPHTTDAVSQLKHLIRHHSISRLIVSNNGQAFSTADWARLKRIADGNPDESKIGAFGVGFYSVFADCDEPFVVSGNKTMAFFWKGNTLLTRTVNLPDDQASPETSFFLEYRQSKAEDGINTNPAPVPDLLSLCQFLSTSLTFVGLQNIELWVDNWMICRLNKKASPESDVALPSGLITKTEEGMMQIKSIAYSNAQIDATWNNILAWNQASVSNPSAILQEQIRTGTNSLKSFFSRLTSGSQGANTSSKTPQKELAQTAEEQVQDKLDGESRATVFTRISTIGIQTNVSNYFARELERATKKPPPRTTRISILTSPFDEAASTLSSATGKSSKIAAKLFSSVVPSKHGRIFIGFPTTQTTGMLCHISAPSVIPTVERESIDLNARHVRTWNTEMLRVAGIACRISYIVDMNEIKARLDRTVEKPGAVPDYRSALKDVVHVFRQYTAQESTPYQNVGVIIESAFWGCSKARSLDVLSTRGILPSHKVRIVSEKLSFLTDVPIIPEELTEKTEGFVQRLFALGMVSKMTIEDVTQGLEARALSEAELSEFLVWCSGKALSEELDEPGIQKLLASTIACFATDPNGPATSILELKYVEDFVNATKISADMPVPPSTIPFKLTKNLSRDQLLALGWSELSMVKWFRWLISGPQLSRITSDAEFASKVLSLLSKQWDGLSASSRNTLSELLSQQPVMPTKLGMRKPIESYFPNVKVFDDLPVISLTHHVKDKLLVALGVRKTIELGFVFSRLDIQNRTGEKTQGASLSHGELIRYFASVRDQMPPNDLKRLKDTAFCPSKAPTGSGAEGGRLYKVSELFVPNDQNERLGLRIIHLPFEYRANTPEGKLLTALGLKAAPTVDDIILVLLNAGATANERLYEYGLRYFIDNFSTNRYSLNEVGRYDTTPFLPSDQHHFPDMVAPKFVFSNPRASIMGFAVLRRDLRPDAGKFGVQSDPAIQVCVDKLIARPPRTMDEARGIFGYMAIRLQEMEPALLQRLGKARIIPVFRLVDVSGKDTREEKWEHRAVEYVDSNSVFIGTDREFGKILRYVNFGEEAHMFLLKIGVKHEPSTPDLAAMVIANPRKFYVELGVEKYLGVLRKFAEHRHILKKEKELWRQMKLSPFLLAHQNTSPQEEEEALDLMDDDEDLKRPSKEYTLHQGSEIVICDEIKYFASFRHLLKVAPPIDQLEEFYEALGAQCFTSILQTSIRTGAPLRDQSAAVRLRKEIIARSRIFLYEYEKDDPKKIKHNPKWLDKHLQIQVVDSLTMDISLKGYRSAYKRERLTVGMAEGSSTLVITQKYDMFEVSNSLIRLLVDRPKQNDIVSLETILSESLHRLKRKGFNVERILQQREHEARMAESERQKQLEAEKEQREEEARKALALQEKQKQADQQPAKERQPGLETAPETPKQKQITMPGAFDESPPNRGIIQAPSSPQRRASGFLKRFQRQLGLSDSPEQNGGGPSNRAQDPSRAHQDSIRSVHSAINSCKPHNSDTLNSQPQSSVVEESKGGYCDTTCAHDLTWIMNISPSGGASSAADEIKFFLARHLPANTLVPTLTPSLRIFARLLAVLRAVFGIRPDAIHIFHDDRTQAIAFNRGGALFFNHFSFERLHLPLFQQTSSSPPRSPIPAFDYWFLVFTHELAHNIVAEHSASHEWYMTNINLEFVGRFRDAVFADSPAAWQRSLGGAGPAETAAAATTSADAPPQYEELDHLGSLN